MEATMMEETKTVKLEVPQPATLDDILPDARKLSAYDKLMLIQILVGELLREPLILLPRNTVIELYEPIEVSGNVAAFEQMIQMTPQNEN